MLIKERTAWINYIGENYSLAWHLKNCTALCLSWWGKVRFYFVFIQVLILVHGRVTSLNITWPVSNDFSCCVLLSSFILSLKYLNPLRGWSEECYHMTEFLFKLNHRKAFKINGSQVLTEEVVLNYSAHPWNRQQCIIRFWAVI